MGSKSDEDVASPGKIFIGGLPEDIQYGKFTEHFARYGKIAYSVITKDEQSGKRMGFGFIRYSNPSIVETVIADTHFFNGKQVVVKRTFPSKSSRDNSYKTRKIFVRHLPSSLTDDEFKNFFSIYGVVTEHRIIRDESNNGRSRGIGYVIFNTEEVVDQLLSKGNMIDMAGTQVEIVKSPKTRSEAE